jgi:hypothetical protein
MIGDQIETHQQRTACASKPVRLSGRQVCAERSAFEARCRVAPGAATPPTCAYVIAIVA